MNTVYIHIGLHKTGTTSLQKFCKENAQFLENRGVKYYTPTFWRSHCNANEVAALILRKGIWSGYTESISQLKGSEQQREEEFLFIVQKHVHDFLRGSHNDNVFISGEHMSLMRTREEARRLKEILTQAGHVPHIILVLRELEDWWKSYCNQIRQKERSCCKDYNSMAYIEDSSWLKDIDALIECIKSTFDNVTVLEYGDNIIPEIFATVGVEIDGVGTQFFLNRRASRAAIVILPIRKKLAKFYNKYISDSFIGRIKRKLIKKSIS